MNRIDEIKDTLRLVKNTGFDATDRIYTEDVEYLLSLNERYVRTFQKIEALAETASDGVTDNVKREQIRRIGEVARVAIKALEE